MIGTEILVIGAGPVGLTMAAELARYGARVRIVDKAAARTDKSKALVVWSHPLVQALRNNLARLVLGLSPVQLDMADKLSEISVGYPDSPLNGPAMRRHHAPAPGERVPPAAGEPPIGAGGRPLFTLFAADAPEAAALAARFPALLDPKLRPPLAEGGIWLARPDGYVAATALSDGWEAIGAYLDRLTTG